MVVEKTGEGKGLLNGFVDFATRGRYGVRRVSLVEEFKKPIKGVPDVTLSDVEIKKMFFESGIPFTELRIVKNP